MIAMDVTKPIRPIERMMRRDSLLRLPCKRLQLTKREKNEPCSFHRTVRLPIHERGELD